MTADEFRSDLRERLNACAGKALLHIVLDDDLTVKLTGPEIIRRSERLANLSTAAAGQVVLLLLPHSVELFLLQIGLILTGRIPAILPWPTTRVDPEKYQVNLLHQLRNLPAQEMITTPRLASVLGAGLPYKVTACAPGGGMRREATFSVELPLSEKRGTESCGLPFKDYAGALFLQFSGGTTGAQKAVVITAPILTFQLESLRQALNFTATDVVVSWLPLYHDMGLIGCLWLPLWHGAQSIQFAAGDWLLNPGRLFELIDRHKGTFCWLPNFAFSYLAGQRERMGGPYSLAQMRGFINCSEPVRLRSMRAFAESFADFGVTLQHVQCSYAMAENVFAVTQTRLGQEPKTFARSMVIEERDRAVLAFDLIDELYVSSGIALPEMKIRILNSRGRVCSDREAGEIYLSTPSLFSGYWGPRGFVTSSFGSDGWHNTGDYGFMADGQLYVIGRLKDIVIAGGQNIFPEDVETVVNTVTGIYPGRVVAFGISNSHDTESLMVIAELKGDYDRDVAMKLEKEISGLVLATIGIAPGRVCVLPERWIVKSTAGKISRRETRERYLRERAHLVEQAVGVGATR
jgi:fatty-acyl-CoA synthase